MGLPLEDKGWQMCPCSVTLLGQCWREWPLKPHSQACSEPCATLCPHSISPTELLPSSYTCPSVLSHPMKLLSEYWAEWRCQTCTWWVPKNLVSGAIQATQAAACSDLSFLCCQRAAVTAVWASRVCLKRKAVSG